MAIKLKTHKLLWGRSGNRCAFPSCKNELIADETMSDDESIIGDEAHIVAQDPNGPRGQSSLSLHERDKYDNLILLCRVHHKIVDDQTNYYTVERLIEMKKEHEKWVNAKLSIDQKKLEDELIYATYIDEIFKMLDHEYWQSWVSSLICHDHPRLNLGRLRVIEKIPNYVISRFWPGRYIKLEKSIFNIKNVLNDLLKVFYYHVDEDLLKGTDDSLVFTKKFYQIDEWNPELYNKLSKEYEYHVDLVEDLTLELTRAGNLVIENVRQFVYKKYRESEGKLLITSGPFADLSWQTYLVEYKTEEKAVEFPYPGLKKFMTERENRNMTKGAGYSGKYFIEDLFKD